MPDGESVLSVEGMGRLSRLAEERFGLLIGESDWPQIRRKLEQRLRGWVQSFGDRWLESLSRLAPEGDRYADLVEALTVAETYFFRSPSQFDSLRSWLRTNRSDGPGPVRMWSAGCSSGDEAYSMAIVASEVFGRGGDSAEILATDINPTALKQADRGAYELPHFRECPETYKAAYFTPLNGNDSEWLVSPQIRRGLTVRHLNLLADSYPTNVDVIFCRNVSVYMAPSAQSTLWRRLASSLHPTGILMVADTESVDRGCGLVRSEFEGCRVFRRKD